VIPRTAPLLLSTLLACAPRPGPAAPTDACPGCTAYETELATWRARREDDLRREHGWLALAGLYWLSDGEHRLGADPRSDIVFPPGSPRQIGTVTLKDGQVHLHAAPGVDVRVGPPELQNPVPVHDIALRSDADPEHPPDHVRLAGGRFTFLIIARGGRLGVRLYDAESPARREFAGLDAFPVDPRWRVTARFEPHVPPKHIDHPTVVGTSQAVVPGVAVFTLAGREHRLTPILEHTDLGDQLLFVFSDETSGAETYKGGRFLLTDLPQDGALVLDFNRAHNPPCAFTAHATCPTPLRDNHLPLRVDAGEKLYRGAH
jgi:uncharacterized protein (DUF1684 family)